MPSLGLGLGLQRGLRSLISYVKSGRVLDLFPGFTSSNTTVIDYSGEGNDATLYSGRFVTTDGSLDRGIVSDCSAAGAGTYYLTGKVKPTAVTVARMTIDGATSSTITGLTANVWQDFQTATSGSITPSSIVVGWDGTTASAADWSDVKLVDASTGLTVARWELNDSADGDLGGYPALDSVGGYHGTHTGCAGGTGETTILQTAGMDWNKRMWFGGIGNGDFVQTVDTADSISQAGFTYSFWFFGNDVTSNQAGIAGYDGATLKQFFSIRTTGIIFYVDPTFTTFEITDTNNLVAGEWNHCVGVYDAGTIRLYVNGALQTSTTTGTILSTYTRYNDFNIGARRDGSNALKGILDDAIIFSDALSTPDVSALYAAGRQATLSVGTPAYRWLNNGNTDAAWVDTVGSNNGTVNGTPSNYLIPESDTTAGEDALGNAIAEPRVNGSQFNFFGDGEYASVADADSLDVDSSFSIEAWVNLGSLSNQTIIAKGGGTTTSFALDYANAAYRLFGYNAGASVFGITTGGNAGNTTSVVHIVGTFDGTTWKQYINGILDVSEVEAATLANGAQDLQIGSRANSAYSDSKIARPKIYSVALTADEVLQNYNAQKGAFGL